MLVCFRGVRTVAIAVPPVIKVAIVTFVVVTFLFICFFIITPANNSLGQVRCCQFWYIIIILLLLILLARVDIVFAVTI